MSNCKQKFLGIDSVDILIDYINNKIEDNKSDVRVCTLQLFKYFKNSDTDLNRPDNNIYYDFDTSTISFPNSYEDTWNTLSIVMEDIKDESLSEGAIYMSSRVQQGISAAEEDKTSEWSKPIKISGVNGKSGVNFRFSYNETCVQDERSKTPLVPSEENPIVYFWALDENDNWPEDDVPGNIWMKYTADGKDGVNGNHGRQVLYRYCATGNNENGEMIVPANPASSIDANWSNTLLNINLSEETPYLWMSTAIVIAGETIEESEANGIFTGWSDPILFSKLGLNGQDGTVPDYIVTLYARGAEEDGLIQPDYLEFVEDQVIDYYKSDAWLDFLPEELEGYWWQRIFKVRGSDNIVLNASVPSRYNGVNGESQPGEWTEMCFKWSENQLRPDLEINEGATYPAGWNPQYPETQPNVGANLWVTVGKFKGMNEDGTAKLIGDWSEPVCISGPVCPVSLDSRFEVRYTNGNATAINPNGTWVDDPAKVTTTNTYPYIWGKQYLAYYKVNYTYEVDENGNFNISETSSSKVPEGVAQETQPYRISGLNGNNGNTKNNIEYKTSADTVIINNFINSNMHIYNGSEEITYEIDYNLIDFESGYTCKFANVGTANVTITTKNPYCFIGSGKTSEDEIRSITISSQETVELVCYKNETEKSFIVIGKAI